jgi:hypothetical protein
LGPRKRSQSEAFAKSVTRTSISEAIESDADETLREKVDIPKSPENAGEYEVEQASDICQPTDPIAAHAAAQLGSTTESLADWFVVKGLNPPVVKLRSFSS